MLSNSITRGYSTNEQNLFVQWSPLIAPADTGDSVILSYNLQYDQGSNNWIDVVGYSSYYSTNSVILTDGITAGVTYYFRIRALNIYGWSSQFSFPYVGIAASGIPAPMSPVSTSYNQTLPTSVLIQWTTPYTNSEPIIDYDILILQANGIYSNSSQCDGTALPV